MGKAQNTISPPIIKRRSDFRTYHGLRMSLKRLARNNGHVVGDFKEILSTASEESLPSFTCRSQFKQPA